MAGAIKRFGYVSDGGQVYGLRVDNTNALGSTGGTSSQGIFPNPSTFTTNVLTPPQGFKPRYANCVSVANPRIRRKLYIGSVTAFEALAAATNPVILIEDYPGPGDTVGNQTQFAVSSLIGERRLRIANSLINAGLTS
jgi:hypothetical protein